MDKEIYERITKKKDFSLLPKKDVELVWKKFEKRNVSDSEKIRLTRDLLRKIYTVFASKKLFVLKERDEKWFLSKHISTRERIDYYSELYSRIFKKSSDKRAVFDLGAGVNGFSYFYLPRNTKYIGVEAVGQLVNLGNKYFEERKIDGKMVHMSLFDLENLSGLFKGFRGDKTLFLFKVLDSLEMIKRDFSKEILLKLAPLVDRVIISFATESLLKRTKFRASRKWLHDFLAQEFEILDEFDLGGERYIVFKNR
ncbi:hypothetical protein B6U91_00445 [Candidatus Pacearchaeota archaeon ex4484_71]|nr:MAG: hypothetical protein B6U91_00445 [Candidatus Pacearchaeota archaeon ex4484_71]